MESRGIRNNNPLNIRRSKDKWQGQINANVNANDNNSSPKGDAEFVQFIVWNMVGEPPL